MLADLVPFVCRVRTSSGMFLNRGEDEIVDRIEARIAKHTAIPKENGEGLQILHYQVSRLCVPVFCFTPAPHTRPGVADVCPDLLKEAPAQSTQSAVCQGDSVWVRKLKQLCPLQASEQYRPHFDYFHDKVNTVNGGQRMATFLMYLSDVPEGGETVFPDSKQKPVRATELARSHRS